MRRRILCCLLIHASALSVALPLLHGRSSIAGDHWTMRNSRYSCMGVWVWWAMVVINEQDALQLLCEAV
jgi:hypothetical protein